jgi:hypothetical protein
MKVREINDQIRHFCNISFSFLIQTTTAATDPDYKFGFTVGTQANATDNSQNTCSGKRVNCWL